jgi:hypothetical protein
MSQLQAINAEVPRAKREPRSPKMRTGLRYHAATRAESLAMLGTLFHTALAVLKPNWLRIM